MLPTAENRKAAQTMATPAGKATAGLVTAERPIGAAISAADENSTRRRRIASSRWRTASPPPVRESQLVAARSTSAVTQPPMLLNTRTQYPPKKAVYRSGQ